MDLAPEGVGEAFIISSQEKTAFRTRSLLVVARLCFVFSHGLLGISASAAIASADQARWWGVFAPVWVGDGLSVFFCIASWFASCPYIQLCLAERQARLGDHNPSILTEILPDIVWGIFGMIFVTLSFVGELMLCSYLTPVKVGHRPRQFWPCALMFTVVAVLASCRGVLVEAGGEAFVFFGVAVLGTVVVALFQPSAACHWVLLFPSFVSALGLVYATLRRLRRYRHVLSRQEKLLSRAEQAVLSLLSVTLVVLIFCVGVNQGGADAVGAGATATVAGVVAGACVSAAAALRAWMALLERRLGTVADRMLTLHATPLDPPSRYLPVTPPLEPLPSGTFADPIATPPSWPSATASNSAAPSSGSAATSSASAAPSRNTSFCDAMDQNGPRQFSHETALSNVAGPL